MDHLQQNCPTHHVPKMGISAKNVYQKNPGNQLVKSPLSSSHLKVGLRRRVLNSEELMESIFSISHLDDDFWNFSSKNFIFKHLAESPKRKENKVTGNIHGQHWLASFFHCQWLADPYRHTVFFWRGPKIVRELSGHLIYIWKFWCAFIRLWKA